MNCFDVNSSKTVNQKSQSESIRVESVDVCSVDFVDFSTGIEAPLELEDEFAL